MSGLCGSIGSEGETITDLVESINTFGHQQDSLFRDDSLQVGYVDHVSVFSEQPATTKGVSIWCWGDILGHEYKQQYTPRPGNLDDAEYCASLYQSYGQSFVAGLNSEFSGIIYNKDSETISLFTDRLGSRPIYYRQIRDGGIVFSSLLQSLSSHPQINLKINSDHLSEFFNHSRIFGTGSIDPDINKVPPGSIVTFDTDGDFINEQKYWWPDPSPQDDKSFSEYVSKFSDVFEKSVSERARNSDNTGLLLSGGTDSRLILELLDDSPITYHMNEGIEGIAEAEVAKQVAEAAGSQFELLERDLSYYPNLLQSIGDFQNFNGRFDHAHAFGFKYEITNQVDSLFCGQYSDTILGGLYIPAKQEAYGRLQHLYPKQVPVSISTQEGFEQLLDSGSLGGRNGNIEFCTEEVGSSPYNVKRKQNCIEFSGVQYPNWDSVLEYASIYPITNVENHVFYETLVQMTPTHYPFLDNRVIDLALQLPTKRRWRDIIPRTLANLNSELSSIPKPDHGLPVHSPYLLKYYTGLGKEVISKMNNMIKSGDKSGRSRTHWGGPWPNHAELIRQHPFVGNLLRENKSRIRDSPYLDYEAIQKCYTAHLNGENNTRQLYVLITLLESPIDIGHR